MRSRKVFLVACLSAAVVSAERQQQPQFRATRETVVVYATALDRSGELVTDLSQQDFEILDNGRKVDVSVFSSETVPITASLLVDVSKSMVGDFMLVREAALKFIPSLQPVDRVRFGTFGGEVGLSPHLTADHGTLERIVREELWPRTGLGTALWSAIRAGMRSLENEPGRRVLVVLTDGVDACEDYERRDIDGLRPQAPKLALLSHQREICATRQDVEVQATRGEFLIYGIGRTGLLSSLFTDIVKEVGGGYMVVDRTTDLGPALERVANELRHQYLLGFTPASFDGKTHRLAVSSTRSGLTVRARRSYVAVAR